jgi:hypothetical protein
LVLLSVQPLSPLRAGVFIAVYLSIAFGRYV